MTPDEIRAVRHACGETRATFGRRLARSGRTVERWELGDRRPDALALRILERMARTHVRKSA